MKKSKSKTIQSKGGSASHKTIEDTPKAYMTKITPFKDINSKVSSKNSPTKLQPSHPCSPKGTMKHYMSNVQLRPPAIKSLKPSQSQYSLKNIPKDIQKPKIVKRKNENLSQLQTKLRTLQNQITNLKSNISSTDEHLQKIRKSRIKSKESKKSSVSASSKKRASESVDRRSEQKVPSVPKQFPKSMVRSPSKGLNSFVTKWKPTESNIQNTPATEQSDNLKSKTKNGYYTKHISPLMKEHLLQSLKIFNYMEKIDKPSNSEIQDLKVKLPNNLKTPSRKTLVFDLDETLIHCVEINEESDIKLPIIFPNGDVVQAGINIRKYAKEILTNLSKKFQVIVFTASHSCYANVILDYIDPQRSIIHHRFFRQSCYKTQQGMFIKDLRIFGNRNLDNIVLIDNAPYSYYFQLSNGIPILPFYNSRADIELRDLQKFLLNEVYPAKRVQPVLQKHFKLSRYKQFSTAQRIIKQLYRD